jgi:hypothetical protein
VRTARGRKVLRRISVEQKAWADALGAEIGEAKLRTLTKAIEQIRRVVASRGLPGMDTRRQNAEPATPDRVSVCGCEMQTAD